MESSAAAELFSGGKIVPLRIPAPSAEDEAAAVAVGATTAQSTRPPEHEHTPASASVAAQQPETPRAEEVKGASAVGGEEPKIPRTEAGCCATPVRLDGGRRSQGRCAGSSAAGRSCRSRRRP